MLGIRTEVDRLIVDLATRLATARCETLENAIAEGLAGTATALGLDRAFLWQEELASIPSIASKLEAGDGFSYTRVGEIPDSADRNTLLRSGLHSAAFVPIVTAATPEGSRALVLGSETPTQWPSDLLAQMRLMAGVFGQALARASTSNALQHALGELRELRVERVDSLPPARVQHGSRLSRNAATSSARSHKWSRSHQCPRLSCCSARRAWERGVRGRDSCPQPAPQA